MDRLIEAIEEAQNPSVVGLDPTPALVPPQVVDSFTDEVRESIEDESELPAARLAVAYFEFNRAIIDAVADIVPAVKPQIAMYEAIGPAGVDTYTMTCEYAQQQGLYVLGDIKRGDIGSTAAAYAGHLSGVTDGDGLYDPWHEDAVTVNPYLGTDGITPFVEAATAHDKDIFVLVRTSNPSSSELQELELAGGEKLYERTADLDIEESYRLCDMWLIAALRGLGLDVGFSGLNDIASSHGKIGGAAQRRFPPIGSGPGSILHHVTLAYDIDAVKMTRVLNISGEKMSDKAVKSAVKRVDPMRAQTGLSRDGLIARLADCLTQPDGPGAN